MPRPREFKQDANSMLLPIVLLIAAGLRSPSVAGLEPSSESRASPAVHRGEQHEAGELPAAEIPTVAGSSINLAAALYATLSSNPDLILLRLGNPLTPSAEAVEVARHFPSTLNPALWIDFRPISLIPFQAFGGSGGSMRHGSFYHFGQQYMLLSLRQPVELGHQTTHRYRIAQAAYDRQRWTVLQAEVTALLQTYRLYQTAVYRRERLKIARELADSNERLYKSLQTRLEANLVPAADVVLAGVESRASRQLAKAAAQDYLTALTDFRNQIGIPESAGEAEPVGEFALPPFVPNMNEQEFVQIALENRPDIHAAQALVEGTCAAVNLARADRIPTPIVGPEYETDEAGLQYVGLVYIQPIPFWNSGGPLLRQREADHRRAHIALQQARQRAVTQVRASVARWNGAAEMVNATRGLAGELNRGVESLERLFDHGQTDITVVMQAQRRLIQLRNTELDALWAAAQAQADLLLALGAQTLLQGMLDPAGVAAAESPAVESTQ
jgi:cobalt-zinc-cadmium efflux system outer membrane protein